MNKTFERRAAQLAALGHPARLALLLQAKLDIPWTTLSHHLDFLWEDCCKNGKGAAKECC